LLGEGRREKGSCKRVPRPSPTQLETSVYEKSLQKRESMPSLVAKKCAAQVTCEGENTCSLYNKNSNTSSCKLLPLACYTKPTRREKHDCMRITPVCKLISKNERHETTVRSARAEQGAGSPSFVRGPDPTGQARFTSPCSLLTPSRGISAPSRSLVNIQAGQGHLHIALIPRICFSEMYLQGRILWKAVDFHQSMGLCPQTDTGVIQLVARRVLDGLLRNLHRLADRTEQIELAYLYTDGCQKCCMVVHGI
jgi:hypothetical protein